MENGLVGYSFDDLAYAMQVMELETEPGGFCQVQLVTPEMPPQYALDQAYQNMLATGHYVTPLTANMVDNVAVISFSIRRDLPLEKYFWPLIIPLLVPLAIVGTVIFGIAKIQEISSSLVPILLIGGAVLLGGIFLLQKPATKYIERGGKVPYLPETELLTKVTPAYHKSNPPSPIEFEGLKYYIHMTFETRKEADEEARSMRESGSPSKTHIVPWEGGYALYEHSLTWDPGKKKFVPDTIPNLEILEKYPDQHIALLELYPYHILRKDDSDNAIVMTWLDTREAQADITKRSDPRFYIVRTDGSKDLLKWREIQEEVKEALRISIGEEVVARRDYLDRAMLANDLPDTKTAELFLHISEEEKHHREELVKRLRALGGRLDIMADSPEYLTETMTTCGYKDKLDQAFQEAIKRVRDGIAV